MTTVVQPLNNGFPTVGKPKRIRARTHTHTHTRHPVHVPSTRHPYTSTRTRTRHPHPTPTASLSTYWADANFLHHQPGHIGQTHGLNGHPLKEYHHMNTLKTLHAELDASKVEVGTIQQKLVEATTRRDSLLAEVQGIDATIEGAELAHASALAAVELGEADNTDATGAALRDAHASALRKPDLIQQRRTADAVIDGLTRRHADAHGRYVALIEQHKAEQTEVVVDRCQQAMDAAHEAVAELRNRIAEAQAARRVLEGLDAGNRWVFGGIDITHHTFNTDPAAVALMTAAIHNEIA